MSFKLKLELLLFAILEFGLLILVVVGTTLPVMQTYDDSVQFTMWERRQIENAATARTPLSEIPNCDYTTEKLKVMAAFAILSIAAALIGLILTILDVLHRPTHKWAAESFGCILWGCSLIVWSVGLGLFHLPMCGGSGFVPSEQQWSLSSAFAVFVSVWVLLTVSLPAMWVIKLYIRPRYWTDPQTAEAGDAVTAMEEGTTVPVEALRRKKSKRSFIAEKGQSPVQAIEATSTSPSSRNAAKQNDHDNDQLDWSPGVKYAKR